LFQKPEEEGFTARSKKSKKLKKEEGRATALLSNP
jgi:hypothetical protein